MMLLFLKASVDMCLPFRSSAIFPRTLTSQNQICEYAFGWDESARTIATKEALSTSFKDILFAWRLSPILPIILESVPASGTLMTKLILFVLATSLMFGALWHSISEGLRVFRKKKL